MGSWRWATVTAREERIAGQISRLQPAPELKAFVIAGCFSLCVAGALRGASVGGEGDGERAGAEAGVLAADERSAGWAGNPPRERAGRRTEFTTWLGEWRSAVGEGRRGLEHQGVAMAEQRRVWLKRLIMTDPAAALGEALPDAVRAGLPREIAARLEMAVEARGDIFPRVGCGAGAAYFGYGATIAGQEFRVYPAEPADLRRARRGAVVRGIAVDGELALEGGRMADRAVAEPDWVFGEKRTLFLRIDFADAAGPVTHDATITSAVSAISDFYAAMSAGRTTFTATILPGVLRAAKARAVYGAAGVVGTTELGNEALALARAYDRANGGTGRYDPERADRWVVIANGVPGFFAGLANTGAKGIWLNTFSPDSATLRLDLAHELGHNQGLNHSNLWQPTAASPLSPGRHVEYGDVFDVMGNTSSFPAGHFNAQQKFFLGYLDQAAVASADRSGTYRLFRHDHREAADVRAVVIPSLADRDYWLEYRRDAAFFELRTKPGVLVHWGRAPAYATGTGTYLLDTTAGSDGDASDAQLVIGAVLADEAAGFTIRPVAVGGVAPNDYIDVRIDFPTGVNPAAGATGVPVVSRQPGIAGVTPEGGVQLAIAASGGGLSFQWRKNGAALSGATEATLTLAATASFAGIYAVSVSNTFGTVLSEALPLIYSQLVNLAVRTPVGSSASALIAGFALRGTGTTPLLLRGIGPALAAFGVSGAATDPRLELFAEGGARLAMNEDWSAVIGTAPATDVAATAASRGAFALSANAKDAAFLVTLPAAVYSAHVTAPAKGLGLFELYDRLDPNAPLRLVNLSARVEVGRGENVLIVGFTLGGNLPRRVLVRGVGPGLTGFGVTGVLADPQLELFRGSTLVAANDNWDGSLAPVAASVGAFALVTGSKDAALRVTLVPGSYTVQISGVADTTGAALVELYELP